MAEVRFRLLVTGRVQGVGFRQSCRVEAEQRGVAGIVRNLADGRVEAVFEGPTEIVEEMVAWCRVGPRMAEVRGVEVESGEPEGLVGFRIG